MAEKSAKNLLEAIERSKQRPLSAVIFALGIRHVGEATAKALADHFKAMEKLMNAKPEELMQIEDIGPVVAQGIARFFLSPPTVNSSKGLNRQVSQCVRKKTQDR